MSSSNLSKKWDEIEKQKSQSPHLSKELVITIVKLMTTHNEKHACFALETLKHHNTNKVKIRMLRCVVCNWKIAIVQDDKQHD